jgi:3-oxocholest-4-en-26-oate---CoA ligase
VIVWSAPPPPQPPSFNLADLFGLVAARIPDRTAVVRGERRWSFAELDANASRMANLLRSALDVGTDGRIAVLSSARVEWLEVMLGAFRARVVPIGVDVRATVDQATALLEHADVEVLVYERRFAPLAAKLLELVPSLRHVLVLDDGTGLAHDVEHTQEYDLALAECLAVAPALHRSGDDLYMHYWGVLRERPRGVIWRQEDLFDAALLGGGIGGRPVATPEQIVEHIGTAAVRLVTVITAPLTHANGQWAALVALLAGGAAVLPTAASFDPHEVWLLVSRERCNTISLMGDEMARPLADAFAEHGDRYDVSSLVIISSGGAPLSPAVRARLQALLPRTLVLDSLGDCLHGTAGLGTAWARRRFAPRPGVAVLDESLRPIVPGSGQVGRLARRGSIPLRYHKDDAATMARFVRDGDGVRWALGSEWATVEADGTIALAAD